MKLQTFCPYKGLCRYCSIDDARQAAWSYPDAYPEVRRISNHVAFEPDTVTVHLASHEAAPPHIGTRPPTKTSWSWPRLAMFRFVGRADWCLSQLQERSGFGGGRLWTGATRPTCRRQPPYLRWNGLSPQRHPTARKCADFEDKELGKVVPYGVYDMTADAGFVSVGITSDTAEFAVQSPLLARTRGTQRYAHARELTSWPTAAARMVRECGSGKSNCKSWPTRPTSQSRPPLSAGHVEVEQN